MWVPFVASLLLVGSEAKMLLTPVAPKGYNTFDQGIANKVNTTSVLHLADILQEQFGYDIFTLDGGWTGGYTDEYGRPIADPTRFPDMKDLTTQLKKKGMKLGAWTMRGLHLPGVLNKLPVKGTNYTMDQLVDQNPTGGKINGTCLWSDNWLGVNTSHPAAKAYYKSRVEIFTDYGMEFIKADCMMCAPCYTAEIEMFSECVREAGAELILSYSPGGGNQAKDGQWVAENELGTMYRIVTDFHGGWYGWGGLQQAVFIAGNFSAVDLAGKNNTWPDLDMIPLSPNWWNKSQEQDDRGQTIATLWMMSKSPLMYAGALPADERTIQYLTKKNAMDVHDNGVGNKVIKYEGNCTCVGGTTGTCTIPKDPVIGASCIATWKADLGLWSSFAVINMGESNATVFTSFALLGLESTQMYTVVNIWTDEVQYVSGGVTTELRPHATEFYRINDM